MKSLSSRLLIASVMIIVAVSLMPIVANAQQLPQQGPVPTPTPVINEESRKEEEAKLNKLSESYNSKWNWYRAAYLGCVIGAAFLSGFAGLLLQLSSTKDKAHIKDVAAGMAFLAAFLITLNTLTGFNAAGVANRVARNEVNKLKVAVLKGQVSSRADIEAKLIEIESNKGDAAIGK